MAPQFGHQITFGNWLNQGILDPEHKLMKLSEAICWESAHEAISPYYSNRGRCGLPIRLMMGLHLLKHMEDMSDAQCADRIRGDLYWMYFCGVEVDDLKQKYAHLNSSSMTKFRNRIGDRGFSAIEDIIRKYLIETKRIDPKVMATDSSCQEKNVEYPTDSGLLNKGRLNLLKGMKKLKELGVKAVSGIRTYSRRSKQVLITIMKLGKDRAERIKAGTLEFIPTKGKQKHPESQKSWFKTGQSMRAGIEAVIGHLKQDHRVNRSRYSGLRGDKINLTLGSMAWNLKKLGRALS